MCGFTPISSEYDTQDKIKDEFKQVELSVQDKQFTIYKTTPNLSDLQNGQIVIFSSGVVRIFFRENQDIYSINTSCITVHK